MRTNKKSFLIVGNGRLAQHFQHYFNLLNIDYLCWNRRDDTESDFLETINAVDRVLLLISDDAIEPFIRRYDLLNKKNLLVMHCSGALHIDHTIAIHPLNTFSDEKYTLYEYQQISFVMEKSDHSFSDLMPGLQNPHVEISPEKKPLYHAWCVLANNATTILWKHFFDVMESQFHIQKTHVLPYLQRTCQNIISNNDLALTGPIARNDQITIQKNLKALENTPFFDIYTALLKITQSESSHEFNL